MDAIITSRPASMSYEKYRKERKESQKQIKRRLKRLYLEYLAVQIVFNEDGANTRKSYPPAIRMTDADGNIYYKAMDKKKSN